MGFVALKCPQCGADIELDDSREFGFCQYCGTKIMQEQQNIHLSGSVSVDKQQEIQSMLARANTLISQHRNKEAIKLYERILEIDATNAEANDKLYELERVITEPNLFICHAPLKSKGTAVINIKIDGEKKNKFTTNDTVSFTLPCGKHTITLWYSLGGKQNFPIEIENCYSRFKMTISSVWGGMKVDTVPLTV